MLLPSVLVLLLAGGTVLGKPAPYDSTFASGRTFEAPVRSRPWQSIVVHHSATAGGDVASIDAVHRGKRDAAGKAWLGIGYHFVIGNGQKMADGQVEPTFRWTQQLAGAHAGSDQQNQRGIGICVIGDFDQADPTPKQVAATRHLIQWLAKRYAISREQVLAHRDVQATACPGKRFPWEAVLADLPPPQDP